MALQSFSDPNSDAARQHLLDRRCERKHPKRHRTQKRAKALSAAKKAGIRAREAEKRRARSAFLSRARAYWGGAPVGHP